MTSTTTTPDGTGQGAVCPGMTVNYFAAARAAAGTPSEPVEAASLAEFLEDAAQRHGPGLAKVLAACSFLVDGVSWTDPDAALPAGSTVDVLPPFAGG